MLSTSAVWSADLVGDINDPVRENLTLLARVQRALGLGRTPTSATFDFDASLEIDRLTAALEDAHGEIARLRQALAACRGGEA